MAFNKTQVLRHYFGGGWATDFGPTADVSPDASGKVVIPWLVDAQDVIYELDGGPRLIGGASKVNASAVASGAVVTGLFDYWRQGTSFSPTRRRVLHAGTVALADTDDGTFSTTIGSGLEADKVPSYCTFDDLLIFCSDSTVDVPRSWDQTTAQSLAGSPPNFSFCVAHKNRAWAAGNAAAPSRLYYSANTDPEDWTGPGSGSIDIDPNDGDIITGIASHKGEIIVFKGPNKGSIHRITGSAPTGSDAFSKLNLAKGIGAAWHNSIFPFGNDLGFVSPYGSVHSLSATAAYGDFLEASLSRPINGWIRDHLNFNRIRNIWAATAPLEGRTYITISIDSSSTNNVVLVMDFRNPQDIRWSRVPAYKQGSLAMFVDTNGIRRVLGGGNDGFVRRLNISDRSIDSATALSYLVTTPYLNYGNPFLMKTLEGAAVGIQPKGDFTTTFGWTRAGATRQTQTFSQSGGGILGSFELDSDVLGGSSFLDKFIATEEGGEFRSIQYDIRQGAVNEDIEVHNFSAVVSPGAVSMEN